MKTDPRFTIATHEMHTGLCIATLPVHTHANQGCYIMLISSLGLLWRIEPYIYRRKHLSGPPYHRFLIES